MTTLSRSKNEGPLQKTPKKPESSTLSLPAAARVENRKSAPTNSSRPTWKTSGKILVFNYLKTPRFTTTVTVLPCLTRELSGDDHPKFASIVSVVSSLLFSAKILKSLIFKNHSLWGFASKRPSHPWFYRALRTR